MAGPDDGVHFPVSEAAFAGDDLGTLIDAGLLGSGPGECIRYSACAVSSGCVDDDVRCRRAVCLHRRRGISIHGSRLAVVARLRCRADLVRTPVLTQEPLDLLPCLPGNPGTISLALPVGS